MSEHHVYNFVPVPHPGNDGTIPLAHFPEKLPVHVTHDRWAEGSCSGRLLVRLETKSELVLGGSQVKQPKGGTVVHPYVLPAGPDRSLLPAIPASSLRGLICSIVEAASCSALRVLGKNTVITEKNKGWKRFDQKEAVLGAKANFPHGFFAKISPDTLPLGGSKDRTMLTPAELLLGVVEQMEDDSAEDGGRCLAGRVRFNHALPDPEKNALLAQAFQKDISLHQPNTDSATLYFNRDDGQEKPIPTSELNIKEHRPKGRKFYLPHFVQDYDERASKPADKSTMSLTVTPLARGVQFWFHVDFDNLSQAELGLLCYAIQPNDDFFHKLGLGKALGYGAVQLQLSAHFAVDRSQRYRLDILEKDDFWHQCWIAPGATPNEWPTRYLREREFAQSSPPSAADLLDLRNRFSENLDQSKSTAAVKKALEAMGNYKALKAKVRYLIPQKDPKAFLPRIRSKEELPVIKHL